MACLYAGCIHRSIYYALRLDDFFFAMSSPYMGVMNFRHRADSEIKERPEGRSAAVDRHLILILPHKKKNV